MDMSTSTRNVCDVWRWTAPELLAPPLQAGGGSAAIAPFTPASDVFAFGMAALEVFTGRPPFAGRYGVNVVISIVSGVRPARPSAETAPQLTDALWTVLEACWAHEPTSRPRADDIVLGLASIQQLGLHMPVKL